MKSKLLKTMAMAMFCLNVLSINVFAGSGLINDVLWGIDADTSSDNTNTPKNAEKKKNVQGEKPSEIKYYTVGSKDYPILLYAYSHYNSQIAAKYDSFCSNTTNGRKTNVFGPEGSSAWQSVDYKEGSVTTTYYKTMYPKVVFEKWTNNKVQESNRTTDYYTWTATGPASWTLRGTQSQAIYFTAPGKYTVTSVPHQTITTESWTTSSSKAYDLFPDGGTNLLKNNYHESSHTFTNTPVERTDLKKVWEFEITPEEVGPPIVPSPNPTPVPVDPSEVDWDVELIE